MRSRIQFHAYYISFDIVAITIVLAQEYPHSWGLGESEADGGYYYYWEKSKGDGGEDQKLIGKTE